MERHPTLLHSCSRAATAAEASFRVDYPNSTTRASRIVALDDDAAELMRQIEEGPWSGARFLSFVATRSSPSLESVPVDATLRAPDGSETLLSDELAGADVAVMIASAERAAQAAAVIGNACAARGIMTAGLVVAADGGTGGIVSALRPYASVLVVAASADYVPAMLTALRA